ncbi:MAG: VanZ family protein [Pseudonocardia sp.]
MEPTPTRRVWPFAVAFAVSLALLLSPGSGTPTPFPDADKVVHVGLFAVLAVTGLLAWRAPVRLAAALVVYGAAIEVAQGILPIARSADPLDLLADAAGVALGVLLGWLMLRRLAARDAPRVAGRKQSVPDDHGCIPGGRTR